MKVEQDVQMFTAGEPNVELDIPSGREQLLVH